MKTIQIKLVSIIEQGAFGVLLIDNIPIAVTLWRTFEKLEQTEPKIPMPQVMPYRMVINPGKYLCKRDWYNKGRYATFEIQVEGHERVLFHLLNTEQESEGCVGIGEEFGNLGGNIAILRSGAGFTEFMNSMKGIDEFELEVIYVG